MIAANTDAAYHGCTISGAPGADTIRLQAGAVYTLTAIHNDADGTNGLPPVTSTITIEGQGATVVRDPAAPHFRIFCVNTVGDLTLQDLIVAQGHTQMAPRSKHTGVAFSCDGAVPRWSAAHSGKTSRRTEAPSPPWAR